MPTGESTGRLKEALQLMCDALRILDTEQAPGEVGAHLDRAIANLRKILDLPPNRQTQH